MNPMNVRQRQVAAASLYLYQKKNFLLLMRILRLNKNKKIIFLMNNSSLYKTKNINFLCKKKSWVGNNRRCTQKRKTLEFEKNFQIKILSKKMMQFRSILNKDLRILYKKEKSKKSYHSSNKDWEIISPMHIKKVFNS